MKLAPVYLLEPEPETGRPSRRALLGCILGAGLTGFAAAWTLGFGAARDVHDASGAPEPRDAELEWALERVDGPLEELLDQQLHFLLVLEKRIEHRAQLWPGVGRLAEAVIDSDSRAGSSDQRRDLADRLVQAIESKAHPRELDRWLPALRRLTR